MGKDADLSIDASEGINTSIPDADINLTNQLPDVKDDLSMPGLPQTDVLKDVNDISGEVKDVNNEFSKLKEHEGDLQKLDEFENAEMPQNAEAELDRFGQVRALKGNISQAQQLQQEQEALLQRYRDKKLLQEEITRKATNVANDYMSKHADRLNIGPHYILRSVRPWIDDAVNLIKNRR